MTAEPCINEQHIRRHGDFLCQNRSHLVAVWGNPVPFWAYPFEWPDEAERLNIVARQCAYGRNRGSSLYIVPGAVRDEYVARLRDEYKNEGGYKWRKGRTSSPKKSDMEGSWTSWADSDPQKFVAPNGLPTDQWPQLAAKHYVEERERTRQLPDCVNAADAVVFTGGGHQFYWYGPRLRPQKVIEPVLRKLIRLTACADEACKNINRLMRLAGTWNPKDSEQRTPQLSEWVFP